MLAAAGAMATPSDAAVTLTPAVDTSTRAGALAAYNTFHKINIATASGSTGNTANCTPGTMSADGMNAAIAEVNYARSMAKLKPVTLNTTWSADAQKAALIQAANAAKGLNHAPTADWACYTAAGAAAAGTSNLHGGTANAATAVASYLNDQGTNNTNVLGHRRWVLDPNQSTMGVGQVGVYNALRLNVLSGQAAPAGSPQYVSWPTAGYFPKAMLPTENTWSFSASDIGVDFSSATVTAKSGSTVIPVTTHALPSAYGKPAIEFFPTTGWTGGADKAITVTVSGMKKGTTVLPAYTYTTTLFDETKATSPQTISWTAPTTGFKGTPLTLTAKASSGLPVTYTSATPTICTVSGATATFLAEGKCRITASVTGNATYAAASTYRDIYVGLSTKKAQTITFTAPTGATNGGSSTLAATASSALAVSYTSTTPTVCTVSGNVMKYLNAGTCAVTANQAGNTTYNAAIPVARSWTVGGLKNNAGTWNPTTTVPVGQTIAINPTWTSGSTMYTAGASMSGSGVCSFVSISQLKFGAKGTCTVTLTQNATATYKAATIVKTFTVN